MTSHSLLDTCCQAYLLSLTVPETPFWQHSFSTCHSSILTASLKHISHSCNKHDCLIPRNYRYIPSPVLPLQHLLLCSILPTRARMVSLSSCTSLLCLRLRSSNIFNHSRHSMHSSSFNFSLFLSTLTSSCRRRQITCLSYRQHQLEGQTNPHQKYGPSARARQARLCQLRMLP